MCFFFFFLVLPSLSIVGLNYSVYSPVREIMRMINKHLATVQHVLLTLCSHNMESYDFDLKEERNSREM